MKGDVGTSPHEKEREQEDAKTKKVIQSHPYIFVSFIITYSEICMYSSPMLNRLNNRNGYVGTGFYYFLCLCRHSYSSPPSFS